MTNTTTVTGEMVSDSDIRDLRAAAGEASDLVQVHACSVALGDESPVTGPEAYEERYGGSGMDATERARIMRIDSATTARRLCERAILDARAQRELA